MKTYFELGFEKRAGALSEGLGSLMWAPISAATGLAGYASGPYSREEQAKVDEHTITNALPGVAGWRLGKRLSRREEDKIHNPRKD